MGRSCTKIEVPYSKLTNVLHTSDEKAYGFRIKCKGEKSGTVFWPEPNSWLFSSRLYVEGKLDYGEYTDKNNVRRQATTIVAGKEQRTKVHFVSLKWRGMGWRTCEIGLSLSPSSECIVGESWENEEALFSFQPVPLDVLWHCVWRDKVRASGCRLLHSLLTQTSWCTRQILRVLRMLVCSAAHQADSSSQSRVHSVLFS